MKCIPTPTNRQYTRKLIEQTESIMTRMRWKAYFFDNKDDDRTTEHYNIKTRKYPPKIKDLEPFETDLLKLIGNIKYMAQLQSWCPYAV